MTPRHKEVIDLWPEQLESRGTGEDEKIEGVSPGRAQFQILRTQRRGTLAINVTFLFLTCQPYSECSSHTN